MGHLQKSRLIPATPADVYSYITDFRNLKDWVESRFEVDFPSGVPRIDQMSRRSVSAREFEVVLKRFGTAVRVVSRVDECKSGTRFSYRQVSGFFKKWIHSQVLTAHGEQNTLLTDLVEFELPMGLLGSLLDDLFVRRELGKILEQRLDVIESHFAHKAARPLDLKTFSGGKLEAE